MLCLNKYANPDLSNEKCKMNYQNSFDCEKRANGMKVAYRW